MNATRKSRTWDQRTGRPPQRKRGGFLIVIVGPTASGKSSLAVKLAKQFDGFIIGADSRQIYKEMKIGTATPPQTELHTVPHFLLGHIRPNKAYTVVDYQRDVSRLLKKTSGLPFLVGGTGLYIDAVTQNWAIPKVKPNAKLRHQLENLSLYTLAKKLTHLDPESARRIDMKNRRRIIRALEVVLTTKESFVSQKKTRPFPYHVLKIGLNPPKDTLEKNIRKRVQKMFRRGLIAETKRLLERYSPNLPAGETGLPAMSGIGYAEVAQFLHGEISKQECIDRIVIRTRQYAKRQMTWFKRDKEIQWIHSYQEVHDLVLDFLQNF